MATKPERSSITFIVASMLFASMASIANAQCDSAGDPLNVCCECNPDWTASAGFLFLRRENQNDSSLVSLVGDPTTRITSRDLDRDFSGGLQLELTRRLDQCNSVQVRYFGLFEQSGEASMTTASAALVQFESNPVVQTASGGRTDASSDSSLNSIELNHLRSLTEDVSMLVGIRYLNLDDELSIQTVSATATKIDTDADNHLFGVQLGLIGELLRTERLFIETVGKAGVFSNRASQRNVASTTAAAVVVDQSDDVAAFVGELGLRTGIQLTSGCSLIGGYQALWLSEVALADDQLSQTDFFATEGLSTDGDVLYHGFHASLQWNY